MTSRLDAKKRRKRSYPHGHDKPFTRVLASTDDNKSEPKPPLPAGMFKTLINPAVRLP